MKLFPLDRAETSRLEPLIACYPYNDYRNYRFISQANQTRILRQEAEEEGDCILTLGDRGAILGFVSYMPLPWDSKVVGVSMAKIGHLIAHAEGVPRAILLKALLQGVLAFAKDKGARHLSLRVDCDDLEAVHCLEAEGFQLMDCLMTYLSHCRSETLPPIKTFYKIREYRPQDREAVLTIAHTMYADYQGRFAVDPFLPPDASRRFYQAWAENACSGERGDRILLAERGERIVGFLTYQFNPTVFKSTGIRIAGRGLAAVLPEGAGSFVGIIKFLLERLQGEGTDLVEFDSKLGNLPALRTYQKLGFRLVRAKYAFHKCIN